MTRRARPASGAVRLLSAAVCAVAFLPLSAGPAAAHPLGNFTTNTSTNLLVRPDGVGLEYVLDLAEIPALQAVQELDDDRDGTADPGEADAHRAAQCAAIAGNLDLTVGGEAVSLDVVGADLTFPPGQAGLDTLRLVCTLEAPAPGLAAGTRIAFEDGNFADRTGWREVTAVGDGMRLASSDVPETSESDRLTAYPEERLAAPLAQRTAALVVGAGGGPAAPAGAAGPGSSLPGGTDRLAEAFTGLVAERTLTVGFALLTLIVAIGLGALHAVAPGHGKTVIAAYLVGRQGTPRQAVALGLTVAVSHTAGVLALGVVLSATDAVAPERVYPWLGIASGLLFTAVGATLLRQALRHGGHDHGHSHGVLDAGHEHAHALDAGHAHALARDADHAHAFDAGHEHAHVRDGDHAHALDADHALARDGHAVGVLVGGHAHGHADGGDAGPGSGAQPLAHDHHHPAESPVVTAALERRRSGTITWRSLVAPGLAGGLVPSPSALVVLLGGIALGRAWFGVALVVAYGVGMGATLVGAGYVLLRARTGLVDRAERAGWARVQRVTAALPVVTACLIVAGGLVLVLRAAATVA